MKGKSKVVMFVIKDEDGKAEKLNTMYERIGNFLWTQTVRRLLSLQCRSVDVVSTDRWPMSRLLHRWSSP